MAATKTLFKFTLLLGLVTLFLLKNGFSAEPGEAVIAVDQFDAGEQARAQQIDRLASDLTDEEQKAIEFEVKDANEAVRLQQGFALDFHFSIPALFYTIRGMYLAYLRQYNEVSTYHERVYEHGAVPSFPQLWKSEQNSLGGKRRHLNKIQRLKREDAPAAAVPPAAASGSPAK